jgi:hypothetical protein
VEGADAYAQEGTFATFFQGQDGRAILDSWAKRLASYRSADITRIRWLPEAGDRDGRRPLRTVELKAG